LIHVEQVFEENLFTVRGKLDHERILDAWAEGGVDGLVVGPMFLNAEKLLPGPKIAWTGGPAIPSFDPNPAVYHRLGVEPAEAGSAALENTFERRRETRKHLMTRARYWGRGWLSGSSKGEPESPMERLFTFEEERRHGQNAGR
jgi:hypothetical protein